MQKAGLASGVLNAARQAGGALGVAVIPALLAPAAHGAHAGHGRPLQAPLLVAAAGYVVAVGLAFAATRRSAPQAQSVSPDADHHADG